MYILGIDPGPQESGWCLYEAGVVVRCGNDSTDYVLSVVLHRAQGLADLLAIEHIKHYGSGMPAGASIFDTCIIIGRLIERWGNLTGRFDTVQLLPRQAVKLELCGSAQAKDSNIRQALIDRLGPPGRKAAPGPTYGVTKHAWAALAVAVVAGEQLKAEAKEAAA